MSHWKVTWFMLVWICFLYKTSTHIQALHLFVFSTFIQVEGWSEFSWIKSIIIQYRARHRVELFASWVNSGRFIKWTDEKCKFLFHCYQCISDTACTFDCFKFISKIETGRWCGNITINGSIPRMCSYWGQSVFEWNRKHQIESTPPTPFITVTEHILLHRKLSFFFIENKKCNAFLSISTSTPYLHNRLYTLRNGVKLIESIFE